MKDDQKSIDLNVLKDFFTVGTYLNGLFEKVILKKHVI